MIDWYKKILLTLNGENESIVNEIGIGEFIYNILIFENTADAEYNLKFALSAITKEFERDLSVSDIIKVSNLIDLNLRFKNSYSCFFFVNLIKKATQSNRRLNNDFAFRKMVKKLLHILSNDYFEPTIYYIDKNDITKSNLPDDPLLRLFEEFYFILCENISSFSRHSDIYDLIFNLILNYSEQDNPPSPIYDFKNDEEEIEKIKSLLPSKKESNNSKIKEPGGKRATYTKRSIYKQSK